ncbi:RNMT-activating mini protein [Cinara cedri]|uniref:RNMT-activating mini protein n=1 Tax=Cinara cedri TaxID=506608 RepID=A0A5E4NCI3_9HEMI|nr:RNMT-activating mini protein [Cinara cedri]
MASDCDSKSTQCFYEVEIKNNITIVKLSESFIDEITEDQQKKLEELEEAFAYRYTDEDKDYVAMKPCKTPPLIPSYRPFSNRSFNNKFRGFKRSRDDGSSNKTPYKKSRYYNDYRR